MQCLMDGSSPSLAALETLWMSVVSSDASEGYREAARKRWRILRAYALLAPSWGSGPSSWAAGLRPGILLRAELRGAVETASSYSRHSCANGTGWDRGSET